jgi:hypothetical protein
MAGFDDARRRPEGLSAISRQLSDVRVQFLDAVPAGLMLRGQPSLSNAMTS